MQEDYAYKTEPKESEIREKKRETNESDIEQTYTQLKEYFYDWLIDRRQFDIYIEPRGGRLPNVPLTDSFEMMSEITEWVKRPENLSLLILGDSGQGKTLLTLHLAHHYWHHTHEKILPIWIWLPDIPEEKRATKLLETRFRMQGLSKRQIALIQQCCQEEDYRLLVLIDGVDEVPTLHNNFYLSNGWWQLDWPKLTVIAACRPEAFAQWQKISYQHLFYTAPRENLKAHETFSEFFLQPFHQSEIDTFLKKYVEQKYGNNSSAIPNQAEKTTARMTSSRHFLAGKYRGELSPLSTNLSGDDEIQDPKDEAILHLERDISFYHEKEKEKEATDNTQSIFGSLENKKKYSWQPATFNNTKKYSNRKISMETQAKWHDWKTYRHYLENIKPLNKLAQNPFVLNILVEALPEITAQAQTDSDDEPFLYTRDHLYKIFTENWLKRQAKRLWDDNEKQKLLYELGSVERLTECLLTYSENLARTALILGGGKLNVLLTDAEMLIPDLMTSQARNERYFQKEPTKEVLELIRSGCLLKHRQNDYHFLHKSIIEYFAARAIFIGVTAIADNFISNLHLEDINQKFSLNTVLLLNEPEIIDLLADKVESYSNFKKLLYRIIKFSKREPLVEIAAANAITILNVAGECFSEKNFSRVRISGADLSNAICYKTNFAQADLSHVLLRNAWLQEANLSQANLHKIKFGELPSIKFDSPIYEVAIDPDEKHLFIIDLKGRLKKYSLSSGKICKSNGLPLLITPSRTKVFKNLYSHAVYSLAISQNCRYVAAGTASGAIHLHDSKNGKARRFILSDVPIGDPKKINRPILFCLNSSLVIYGGKTALQIWDIKSEKCLYEFKKFSENSYRQELVALSPDEQTLVCLEDGILLKYSIPNMIQQQNEHSLNDYCIDPVETITLKGTIKRITFSPSGKWLGMLASHLSEDDNQSGFIEFWDTNLWQPVKSLSFPNTNIKDFSFSADESLVIIESAKEIMTFLINAERELFTIAIPMSHGIKNSFVNHAESKVLPSLKSSSQIVYYYVNNILYLWLTKNSTLSSLQRHYHLPEISLVEFGFISGQEEFSMFNEMMSELFEEADIEPEEIVDLIASKDKYGLITKPIESLMNMKFDIVTLLSPNKCYQAQAALNLSGEEYQMVEYAPMMKGLFRYVNGMQFALIRAIQIRDIRQDKMIHIYNHHNPIRSMIFSADSQWLVTAGYTVRLWDLGADNNKCTHCYKDFTRWVNAIALSQDKSCLAVADSSTTISLWETQKPYRRLTSAENIGVRIKQMQFSRESNYLMCTDEKNNKLLFQLASDDTKKEISLKLVNREASLNVNAISANISGAIGLSENNHRFLQQRGAIGNPSSFKKINCSKGLELDFVNLRQAIIKTKIHITIEEEFPVSYEDWIVSILRHPRSDNPDHALLVLVGLNAYGKGIVIKLHLVNDRNNPGRGLILIDLYTDILKKDIETFIKTTLLKQSTFECKSWSISLEQALSLYADAKADREKEIHYRVLGNKSIFVKSTHSMLIHNCFTWAREKLHKLNDPTIQLPEKYIDFIGAKTSFYISKKAVPARGKFFSH